MDIQFFFFHGSMKTFNQLAEKKKKKKKKNLLKIFLSSIKTKVAIRFPKTFFFSTKTHLDAERVIGQCHTRMCHWGVVQTSHVTYIYAILLMELKKFKSCYTTFVMYYKLISITQAVFPHHKN